MTRLLVVSCLSLCAPALAFGQTLTRLSDVADSYEGQPVSWQVARYAGTNAAGTGPASIQFGLALPLGYTPDADLEYPLVLYLHGAGARGSNIRSVLQRQTARYFASHAQSSLKYGAIVVAPQVPSGQRWADTDWALGPYNQTAATYTDSMALTDSLIDFLTDGSSNAALGDVFGVDANDIDTRRLYVVGDSMGAYGTWDIIARHPHRYAAAIAAAGSGPRNKLDEIMETPFWVIHGQSDSTVPNRLPTSADPDGAGSLGMLALIDPTFDNTTSTALVRLDNAATAGDDPNLNDTLIYTEVPGLGHGTVAMEWTTRVSGVRDWLFAHNAPVVPDPDVTGDRRVDARDLDALARHWLDVDCVPDDLCRGADIDGSGKVDLIDMAFLARDWRLDNSQAPLAWWPFDEGAGPLAYDGVGDNHGVLANMDDTSWIEGHFGQALRFDGADDYVNVPQVVDADFSIVLWMRTDRPSSPAGRTIHWSGGNGVVDADVAGNADDFGLSMYRHNLAFGVGRTTGGDVTLVSAASMTDGQWHHVAVVREAASGTMQLYIDGVLDAETVGPTGPKSAAPQLRIGCIQSVTTRCFAGDLDDVRIYGRPLSAIEIADLAVE